MHKVSIKNKTENSCFPTHVSIDGQRIRAVSVNFNQSIDTVPTCEIEIRALPDIETLANIKFQFTPQTVEEAVEVLRHELMTNKDLYNAFLDSIASVLKETSAEDGLYEVAKMIADRIIGEE